MDGFDATMQNYDANSQFMVEIYDLIEQFKRISQDIQPVVIAIYKACW